MPDAPADRFRRYYAEKLWELIPPIYRHEDGIAKQPGVLRALVEVLAEQAAILRRSSDRLWEDQVIDFCDDWAVPYLGDLLGTRMVSVLDPRGRRVDVANTIYYRRRAGTLAVLEGLVADITGWEGTVVEEFRRLVRLPHGLDPAPARTGRFTGTPAYGLPDLRRPRGAELASAAWDEYHYLPDVRCSLGGLDGRHGMTRLAFHLFRLPAYRIERATPKLLSPRASGGVRFAFDPSGRANPLFQRHSRAASASEWRAAQEWELPAPMRCEVLANAEFEITEAMIAAWLGDRVVSEDQATKLRTLRGLRFATERRFREQVAAALGVPFEGLGESRHRVLADALVGDCGKAALLPAASDTGAGDTGSVEVEERATWFTPVRRERTVAGNLLGAVPQPADKRLIIDAENGLGEFIDGTPLKDVYVSYYHGFSGAVGAGSYHRPGLPGVPAPNQLSGGGSFVWPEATQDVQIEIADSRTYEGLPSPLSVDRLLLQARNQQRPYIVLGGGWELSAGSIDSSLTLDGLWLGSDRPRVVHLTAVPGSPRRGWGRVTLRNVTFDPGGLTADGNLIGPVSLSIESRVAELVIESSILGCITVTGDGFVEKLTIRNSIVHGPGNGAAISLGRGELDIRSCTVIGELQAHRLEASELLCTGPITIDDVQAGGIRFSAFPPGSVVPRAYRTQPLTDPDALFTSLRFGDPGYAQLSSRAPVAIARGGEHDTEIGAFHALLYPIKLDSLRTKVDEFLPFGLIPLYLMET